MLKSLVPIFIFLLLSFSLSAQITPAEGSNLHYRIIGFRFPAEKNAKSYKLQIALGDFSREDSFAKHVINNTSTKEDRVIIEVPSFGKNYTWRIQYEGAGGKVVRKSEFHHFKTGTNSRIDTNLFRMSVLQPAAPAYKDYYVAVDAGGIIYDMNGRAVWYMPDTNGFGGNVACLTITPQGSATFIYNNCFEINYNGGVLWKSPKNGIFLGDSTHCDLFHHEFIKRPNGHFMALAMELLMCKPGTKDGKPFVELNPDRSLEQSGYKLGKFGVIMEFDETGKVIWKWQSSKYLTDADLAYFHPSDAEQTYDPHDNAFYFDERKGVIYLGFRNMNRIIQIEYPSGKVIKTYGEQFKPGATSDGGDLFCNQHNIGRTHDGYLYYFNNNSCHPGMPPTLEMLQEPATDADNLKKVWEFICPVEGSYHTFASGGNLMELPDHSLFVNMGSKYSKLFIMNRDKKMFWAALPERYIESDLKWATMHEYRATIISRQELEKFIWNGEATTTNH